MLPLSDPLWEKLGGAFRDQDVPHLLSELAAAWDKEKASTRLYDELHHQGTLYSATYAAVPHLMEIAEPDANRLQRSEIALFLGYIALCALEHGPVPPLQGLPETLEGWDRKLDSYRTLVARYEDPSRRSSAYERRQLLPRYRKILATAPVDAGDLEKIEAIRAEFLSLLPRIGALCERVLIESVGDDDGTAPYLLSGIAATDGLLPLARLLNDGAEGQFSCPVCGWGYEYALFGDRIAIYADPTESPRTYNARLLRDCEDKAPSRADGFIAPAEPGDISDPRAQRLLSLADRSPSPVASLLLCNFLGRIQCRKCGAPAALQGGLS
jgi:hypothetical protein